MTKVRAAVGQQVERGAHHLGLAAEAVGILDPAAIFMAAADCAAFEEGADVRRDGNLAGLAAKLAKARIEGFDAAFKRIDRHCARGQRGAEDPFAEEQRVERDGAARLRAVDQRQPFLGTER